MTRRGALIGTMLMAASELVRAEQEKFTVNRSELAASILTFDFTSDLGFKALTLKLTDKTVTFTREELQREFEHVHRAEGWGSDVAFVVGPNGRKLDVCAECGQTFWRAEVK
ncbi:MAG: hypothetical protein V1790_11415 [Planctomycetota bacterium]